MKPISSHCPLLHKSSKGCLSVIICAFPVLMNKTWNPFLHIVLLFTNPQKVALTTLICFAVFMNKIWDPFLHIVLFFTNSCKAAFQYEWSVHSSRCLQNMKPISSHGSLLRKFLQGWFQVMIFAFQNFWRNISHSHHIEVWENYIDWVPINSSIEQKQEEVVPDVLSSLSSRIWSLSSSSVWSGAQVMLKSFANPWSIWWCFPAFSDFGTSIEMTMMKSSTTSVTQKHQPILLFDQKFLGKKLILVTSWLLLFFTPIDCVLPINWWPLKSRLSPLLE